jgi:polar amino acid transport system substrate-binding protein
VTTSNWSRRDFMMRSGAAAFAVTGLSAAAAGCAEAGGIKTLEQIKEQGYITVGFAGEVPYGFKSGNKITGEAPEVARVVLKALGVNELRGTEVKFEALIPGLVKGDYDMVAAGMFINEERCRQVLFSDPDYAAPNAFLVKKGNPKKLTDFASVGKNNALMGTGSGYAEIQFAKDAKVPEDKIKILADGPTMWSELESGKIDAIAATRISLQTLLDQHKGAPFEITPTFYPTVGGQQTKNGGGFAFHKQAKQLRDAFNTELVKLKQADKIFPIIQPFGFVKQEADDAKNLTAAQLGCK